MRKLTRVIPVLAATVALAAPSAALAYPSNGGGNSANAPGQATAANRCDLAVDRQLAAGLQAGGGPKSVDLGPLNCDHFWQIGGVIGGGS